MTDPVDDDGLSDVQLSGAAWALALVTVGCFVRLLLLAGDGTPVESEHLVWLAACLVSAALTATCAVLSEIKAAEVRLSIRLHEVRRQPD